MLLAKPDESLIEHTENVLRVFSSIREAYPEVPKLCGVRQFWDNLFYAIFLHDFGKGTKGFQEELKTGKRWNYRHEILSAGFVFAIDVPENDKMAIALTIITHHKDIQDLRKKYATYPEDNPGFERYKEKLQEIDLEEMNHLLDLIPRFSEKYLARRLENFHHVNDYDDLVDAYQNYVVKYYKQYKLDERTTLHGKYGIFLKGFLTASDHLASAGETRIKTAISDIERYFKFRRLSSVQERARRHKGSVFIISPTGSGKTEAALLWAQENQNPLNSRRIFYILPYTASINYMYKRLINLFGDDNIVAVLHGKSSYFLYRFFSEGKENLNYEEARDFAKKYQSLARKIFKPYKIVTPFQIIKAFFGLKGFEQNISEMVEGLFIFDEIHSYDPHTTSLILEISRFIKDELNGKILFMTATMPEFLKRYFQEQLGIGEEITMDDYELKCFTRHRLKVLRGSIMQYIDLIKRDIQTGRRILVAVNTVKQAQNVYNTLRDVFNSALLHSRFILRDREDIESNLNDRNLLVGTQVIEVSLDIDYDIMYTEPAPIDALLQRFGRINRRGNKGLAPVHIFTEGSGIGRIYSKERTERSLHILSKVDVLDELLVQDMVNEVYKDGYNEREIKILKDVSENFRKFYRSNAPFIDVHKDESEFYNLFKSVEVIPSIFFDEYAENVENKRFYEAMKYMLPISLNQYNYLSKENRVSKTDFGLVIDAFYDSELGLVLDKELKDTYII
ncbi:MAG: CRISPR-associated helicase/endonuclease Cas3 [Thermotoga sp.]|nr:MAG: CRISPR-associated helicase/endonuclease Cas3 [Thermotoga sp.]